MLKFLMTVMLSSLTFLGFTQANHPVSWTVNAEKIDLLTYKVNIQATIKDPYHIYPQHSSGGGLGMPTEIKFSDTPGVAYVGVIEEKGVEDNKDKRVAYYAKGVTFSQVVRLKSDEPFILSFQVKSMACNDFMCMPPSTKQFTLTINGQTTADEKNTSSNDSLQGIATVVRYEDFEMTDTEGKVVSSKDIITKSKYTFIDFWASWCAPCRVQGREMIPLYNKYQAQGFQVIGISLDTNIEAWKKAIQQDGYAWINLSDLKGFNSAMVKKYNITAIPRNFIVDNNGEIIAKDLHGAELETRLAELFGR
ncbi:TlpA family protein disulfide reductase [Sphingobacterium alkalisoli]|uniref:TlpA family protein disulfide reductase n=1 Tax=Sphingobacterium alkalisoli TaxID=1874115 RepID=A0A4U0GR94_9SPHI|nr:TlpA disulfide reductase family protein [Sphingobacterium alkalisoli]TJY61481.1 TlpA family protein disulfide reductase [Sphingobacterium alkalisoli]GGH30120.1 hypothetical protein GCM10011418_41940 [Sphingobacterium alkalisoli]